LNKTSMGISFLKKKRRHWLEDFAWRVERVTQKFRLSSVSFLSVYLFSVTVVNAVLRSWFQTLKENLYLVRIYSGWTNLVPRLFPWTSFPCIINSSIRGKYAFCHSIYSCIINHPQISLQSFEKGNASIWLL
jgi:hypothetical protein